MVNLKINLKNILANYKSVKSSMPKSLLVLLWELACHLHIMMSKLSILNVEPYWKPAFPLHITVGNELSVWSEYKFWHSLFKGWYGAGFQGWVSSLKKPRNSTRLRKNSSGQCLPQWTGCFFVSVTCGTWAPYAPEPFKGTLRFNASRGGINWLEKSVNILVESQNSLWPYRESRRWNIWRMWCRGTC